MSTEPPSPSPSAVLAPLRDAIADVDRALLELLRRRMDLAAEIGRIKAASASTPIVARDIEERVLSRARRYAEVCGVSEKNLADVFEAIIRASVERQHRVGIALREQRGGRVLVVGGAGGMGTWFRSFLELAGHSVDVVDLALEGLPTQNGRYGSLAEVADLDAYLAILVSVPLGRMADALSDVVARRPRGTVVEIASIKDPLR
ncbi:MAG TPA: chorismate mutase, partial [Thermoanaerobaculia bacterium]